MDEPTKPPPGTVAPPPERIYLQWHGDATHPETHPDAPQPAEVSWCADRIYDSDVAYIRAGKATAHIIDQHDALLNALETLRDAEADDVMEAWDLADEALAMLGRKTFSKKHKESE